MSRQIRKIASPSCSRAAVTAQVFLFALLLNASPAAAQVQSYNVLYNFTGGADGESPYAGVTMDAAGNLYGTTYTGGSQVARCNDGGYYGCGAVYKLSHKGTGWVLTPLYDFQGLAHSDGSAPLARVIVGPDGSLYGSTEMGGSPGCFGGYGCGTIFNLKPPARPPADASSPWTETVLYRFTGGADGGSPQYGDLVFDSAGNLYGTAQVGGAYGYGVVFRLKRSSSGWTESVLYSFTGGLDGGKPYSGVFLDASGSLWGTAPIGGQHGYGVVYKLTSAGARWTESPVYSFTSYNDGSGPIGGVIFDQAGNIHGTTPHSAYGPGGVAYELSLSNGKWVLVHAYDFQEGNGDAVNSMVLDAADNLYLAAPGDPPFGYGAAYKFTSTDGGPIYYFDNNGNGAYAPSGIVTVDASGNIYGTASRGGTQGGGVIWEITP